jgi:hypothetical protein
MSKSKAKGTRRETWVVKLLQEHGLAAKRSPTNTAAMDVEAKAGPFPLAIEVKDRGQLNLHETLATVQEKHPSRIPHVVWHRTRKAESRRTPVGPTLIALPIEEYAKLMSYMDMLWREYYETRNRGTAPRAEGRGVEGPGEVREL